MADSAETDVDTPGERLLTELAAHDAVAVVPPRIAAWPRPPG